MRKIVSVKSFDLIKGKGFWTDFNVDGSLADVAFVEVTGRGAKPE